VNARNFARDPSLRRLIDVVGIGFPKHQPAVGPNLRGIHAAFSADSRIVLWGGGIWDWLDPLTLVRAWPAVLARCPAARLVFLGTRHPNPAVPKHKIADDTIALAEALGEKDRSIFFVEWLPYAEREALLSEADIGVTLHPVHVETRYAIRTRVLDYFWAQLPVLVTEGDVTSEWVRAWGLGHVVPPHDNDAVAHALAEMLARPKADWAPAFAPLRDRFAWPQVAEPLRRYCLQADYAPDRPQAVASSPVPRGSLQQVFYWWRVEGLRLMLRRAWRYLNLRRRGF
jgi:glycosyltransferase involved in cell wall biosynthesis